MGRAVPGPERHSSRAGTARSAGPPGPLARRRWLRNGAEGEALRGGRPDAPLSAASPRADRLGAALAGSRRVVAAGPPGRPRAPWLQLGLGNQGPARIRD